ncbi:EamA family transporter RarD [Sphingomonas sp. SRS2]|uniref:EamA family transporter RarD n=1 Tax=Sphingomonas sp. SRS2 TaxID=133190 RepID=UPI0006184A06|nr:EamA family transporter RarD [Sphingomonas sp. SRS2]KKC27080.1 multidrug DMT transporter [Sphingomonas sp. SRS2]
MPALSPARTGVLMGVGAYGLWGVLPLYLKALLPLSSMDILSYRILWSLLLLALIALVYKRAGAALGALRRPRIALALLATTVLAAGNWLLYIHAVNSGHALQASLGYFINPLVNVLLGMVFLRERLGRAEAVAVLLAAAGVAALTIEQGALPVMPLALGFTFSLYGLIRKVIGIAPVEGLLIETGLLAPLAIAWLLFASTPPPADAGPLPSLPMIALGGVMTTVPLLLFNGAAQRIRYSELGLLQYIGPTIALLIAIYVFGEPLLPIHILTFGLIWTGLVFYAAATWHRGRVTPALPE